jgi:4a-hydroxytetrahydrobiopterin dehydratase
MNKRDIKKALTQLSGWKVKDNKIVKRYVFDNFKEAVAFMVWCALEIDKANHHPEWFNVYNKINVELTTHDVGSVTMKDIKLAKMMDRIATRIQLKE